MRGHARALVAIGLIASIASGCSTVTQIAGPTVDCEIPEPRCSEIVAEARAWAEDSHPGTPIVRIRVMSHGGYEIHYEDGTSEAVVP